MTSTPSLTCRIPRSAWLDAFSMRLGELTSELSPAQADAYAAQSYDEAADLDPAEAAEIFALEMPPGEVGAP
jgi:hypothetical protein